MPTSISTGCCHDLGLDRLESIHYLEKFAASIDGIEVLFAYPQELLDFNFDKKALSFLNRMKFTSIHMPFKNVEYSNNGETFKLVRKAEQLAKETNAKYLVFHPQTVKEFSSIKAHAQVCIENLNKKPENKGYQTVKEIEQLLKKHDFWGLVMDTAHAIGNNINPKDFLMLKNKIKAIHVSALWKKGEKIKEHGFLVETNPKQLEKYETVLATNIPKIIEADFYPEKVALIEKEISLIEKLGQQTRFVGRAKA